MKASLMQAMMVIALLALVATGLYATEDEDFEQRIEAFTAVKKEKAMALLATQQEAIIQVEVVLNLTAHVGGRQQTQERKLTIPGTVLDACGLTVISASTIDPKMQQGQQNIRIESQVLGAKLILNDGTEITARVALKDEDLDLAFVVPEQADPERNFPFVALARDTEVKVLDEVLAFSRMDMNANRTPLVHGGMIAGIIERPRRYYVGPQVVPGNPAFTSEGQPLGIFLRRRVASGAVAEVIILPAADVLDAAGQVKTDAPHAE